MDITATKKLVFVMMAFVITTSHFRCAAVKDTCRTLSSSKVNRGDQKEEIMYGDSSVIMCDHRRDTECWEVTYVAIQTACAHVFETEQAAQEHIDMQSRMDPYQNNCDYETEECTYIDEEKSSCATSRYYTFTREPRDNIDFMKCYIIQLPDVHQYTENAGCGKHGKCKWCMVKKKIHSMLAWCPGTKGIKLYDFYYRAFCTCQADVIRSLFGNNYKQQTTNSNKST